MTTTAVETKSGRIARISNSLIGVSSRCQENTSETALMINTAEHLLADIRELAPVITERATEIDAGRRIPPDLVEALRSIGVFRMLVPHSHGGLALDLPKAPQLHEALSPIDGSALCPRGGSQSPDRPGRGGRRCFGASSCGRATGR